MSASLKKKVREIVAAAEAQGISVTEAKGNGYYRLHSPSGAYMGELPCTPSSPTAVLNRQKQLQRAGLVFPFNVKAARKAARRSRAA